MARKRQAESESGSEDAHMKEAASLEAEDVSEDEAASSAEEASDEAEEESEEEGSDSDAPKVELPNRTTRGKRMVLDQESGEGQVAFLSLRVAELAVDHSAVTFSMVSIA